MNLNELKQKLENTRYKVSAPAGANFLFVSGYGKKYFKAKKAKAKTIEAELKAQGYNVQTKLHIDGYFDFIVHP
jgi:hypothetical protein